MNRADRFVLSVVVICCLVTIAPLVILSDLLKLCRIKPAK